MANIMDRLDLPEESMPGVPVVEIAGTNRVLIEHHGGVTEYGCHQIRVKVKYGTVCICGDGLKLTRMSRQQLIVSGRICAVTLERTGRQ